MNVLLRAAAAVVLAGALSSPAMATPHRHHHHHHAHYLPLPPPPPPEPIASIHLHGGSVGFIVGVGGASGYVRFHGEDFPIEVSGLKVGTIGISGYDLDGRVFHLRHLSEIEGDYSTSEASATAVAGGGDIDMTNANGVEIRASSTSAGLQLTLAGGGVTIRLRH